VTFVGGILSLRVRFHNLWVDESTKSMVSARFLPVIEQARSRDFAQLGDSGQHQVYCKASVTWEDKNWW